MDSSGVFGVFVEGVGFELAGHTGCGWFKEETLGRSGSVNEVDSCRIVRFGN